jgi:hypothetical protein
VNTLLAGNIPTIIDGGRVVLYSRIDERHELTGAGWQILHGEDVLAPAWGVAICESMDTGGFILVSCEEDWIPVAETRHPTLEAAKRQAEFEYDGLQSTWQMPLS